ncbi:MAG: DNA adenine methylase [Endomicrobiaceae bacterium]|jgi:adenine-specific DNA-methyltransferase|nr:DNA adenine methylase [Endomicrobiaceae bacterium]
MNYIGSKLSLLRFLDESIEKVAGKNCRVFCDLFAGTGIVGTHFKKKGYQVIANDIQYYSFVLNKQYIENHRPLKFKNLEEILPQLKKMPIENRKTAVCEFLSNLKGAEGFIYKNYCAGGTKGKEHERQYFSDENGKKCDAIRIKIEEWKNNKSINNNEYYFLLATLIETIDKYANTASVYGAYLKKLKKTARKTIVLKPAELIINDKDHKVFNEDINQLIQKIEGDILYLDPPYNQRQYATNYHLLETIAKYDNPEIHGKTGLRNYESQKSFYCSRSKVKTTFRNLIANAKVKYIFLSYNNEGLMTVNDIKEIMSTHGKYGYFAKAHSRFKADKNENRDYRADKTTEYLHYVVCD